MAQLYHHAASAASTMPERREGGFLALNADFYLAIGYPRCRLAGDL
ncbi:hypothetical protein IM817_09145 [Serratia marcescens]|nr:hypothetical protein [Serratia marcescens]QXX98326.1 hypothetical protein IM817_09145 [Serratia marcescens]